MSIGKILMFTVGAVVAVAVGAFILSRIGFLGPKLGFASPAPITGA